MIKVLDTTFSKNGNKIELLEKSSETADKTVLIIGVFHGDEPQGELLINRFLSEVKEKKIKNRLLFIPCLNPDGKDLQTRQNGNGVDLNRNFPTENYVVTEDKHYFGGNISSSEIETKFLINILEKYKFDFILSFHAPYKVVNFDGPAEKEAKRISEIIGYPTEEDIGYPTPGSFGTYAGKERQIPTVTLELEEDTSEDELWQKTKQVFEYCADEL